MNKMRFDVKCVKECLKVKGKVFSVRSYCLENCEVFVEGVGICRRIRGFEVKRKEELERFVKLSGFESVDEWWNKICEFCGGKRKWVYVVKRVNMA
jgi:hypothetical protein